MKQICTIVMAAGHGTRMKSTLPKVLHQAAGRPLVYYPIRAALEAMAERDLVGQVVVVVNPQTEAAIVSAVRVHLPEAPIQFAVQEVPRGTGDAVRAGLTRADSEASHYLILSGDTPLLSASDLAPLFQRVEAGDALSLLSFFPPDPRGYGRVVRAEDGQPSAIVEHKDLSPSERGIKEVNAGVYLVEAQALRLGLSRLTPENAQGEYYLTDLVRWLHGSVAMSAETTSLEATLGVNDRSELAQAEEILHARIRTRLQKSGVTILGRPLIDEMVVVASESTIEDGVRLRGRTSLGSGVRIDVGSVVDDSSIGAGTHIKPYCVVTDSVVKERAQLGPFAHLRPGSHIDDEAHVGNFVETKNARLGRGAKANHLSYLGDGDVGEKSNLGAGTIFCNYDGFRKSRTVIGKNAFIGSDSQLVAPVTIGDGAYVATGTTVTSDVPPGALAIGRVRQENKLDYAASLRKRLALRAEKKPD